MVNTNYHQGYPDESSGLQTPTIQLELMSQVYRTWTVSGSIISGLGQGDVSRDYVTVARVTNIPKVTN